MAYIPVQDGTVSLKDSIGTLVEVFDLVVFVNKSNIHRQGVEDAQQFFSSKSAGGQLNMASRLLSLVNSLFLGPFRGPVFQRIVKAITDFKRLLADLVPVGLG